MNLVLALFLAIATGGAPSPAEGVRLLQKALETKDVAALEAILDPDERAWMRRDVARDGVDAVMARLPRGPLAEGYKAAHVVVYSDATGRVVTFTREGSRWYFGGTFHEKQEPNGPPVDAAKAYELLRARAREWRPDARLDSLYIPNGKSLDADGASPSWVADFLSDSGEKVTCFYDKGEISGPVGNGSARPGRDGIDDPDGVRYDTKMLRAETIKRAAGIVDPITSIAASLIRSARTGKAIWMVNVFGDDDRIGLTVVFDAHTLAFSHQTR